MKNCAKCCNSETGRRLIERNNKHSGRDTNSQILKYSIEANYPTVTLDDFTVLSSGYRNRKFKRKVSESLFIKHNRNMFNKHE